MPLQDLQSRAIGLLPHFVPKTVWYAVMFRDPNVACGTVGSSVRDLTELLEEIATGGVSGGPS